jgi:hypothetical protein
VDEHPPEWMWCKLLPAYFGAALFHVESWVVLKPKERAELAPNAPTDERGRVECWSVVAVSRDGDEVYARYYRGGPDVRMVGVPAGPRSRKNCDCGMVHVHGTGDLESDSEFVDGMRRMMRLPTRNRVSQPYLRLLNTWAVICEGTLEKVPPEPFRLLELLDMRIDWLVLSHIIALQVGREAEQIELPLVSANAAQMFGDRAEKVDEAINVALGSDEQAVAEFSEFLTEADRLWQGLPDLGWEPIEVYARHVEAGIRETSKEGSWSRDLVEWMGPALWLDQRVRPIAVTNAAGRLARDERLPGWFRDSVTRALNAASAIELT